LEEGELGRELGEFGGDAVDDVGDGSAVRVNDIILLWREVPSSEGKANDNCSEFHVGGLGANVNAIIERDDYCALLLPVGASGDDGYAG